ncbi:hypothetical protein [Pelagicoccus sp. SDUM812002]|uniref:hypothetical protein n=1 Tax=Pelagicoccus sp. SDUM812002 TaxID=3041266 RepID=UPI00280EC293|nr:hypothetical protein [Pelagicoccus sp. SDUM812002]MDQ8188597.1 hypothetical protein [Pelagicoccus sp. SDUM812002]
MESNLIGNFLVALFGALAGATAAFWFQNEKDKKDRNDREYSAATAAYFLLIARLNSVECFCREHLNEARTKIMDEISERMIFFYTHPEPVEFKSLAYLADRGHGQFIQDLRLAESHYFDFASALEERNLDIRKGNEGAITEVDPSSGKIETLVKVHDKIIITDQTQNLAESARSAANDLKRQASKLADLIRIEFPEKTHHSFKLK